jgi:WD40 repeat protein
VSASLDTTLKVWDLDTGEDLRTLAGHEAAVEAVAITSDGRRAVSGSTDNTLRVWDLETAEPIAMASLPAEVASLALDESIVCVGDSAGGFHCFRFVEAAPPRARAG